MVCFFLPTFRRPQQSHATFFSCLTTSVTTHKAIYCQYVLASGISPALSPFGCHKPAVSFLLTCILVTRVHLSFMQIVTCLTTVSHFTLHLFAILAFCPFCLSTLFACCILFPVRISLLLSTNA